MDIYAHQPYIYIDGYAKEEVAAAFEARTGQSFTDKLEEVQKTGQLACADNCCLEASISGEGSDTVIIVDCGVTKPRCIERSNEAFATVSNLIDEVLGD